MTEGLGSQLQHTHDLTVEGPMPEGLDLASTGAIPKHLAHLAMQAAADGYDAGHWRASVVTQIPDVSSDTLDAAEQFMRESGLWPWQDDSEHAAPA